jgi:tRNA (guanosine-2'-O-)-methyltransferase
MDRTTAAALTAHLERFLSPERITRLGGVLENRTRYITLVLEDIYKSQNASATIRTCDALGIQDVHIIENHSPFSLDAKVTMGSCQWASLHRWREQGADNTQACYAALRDQGYRIIATAPGPASCTLDEVSLERKCAFVFGNEEQGLSAAAIDGADVRVSLPMYGFTQSYNISVSVGMVLMHMSVRLRSSAIDWRLSEDERAALRLEWYRTVVRSDDLIEKRFLMNSQAR